MLAPTTTTHTGTRLMVTVAALVVILAGLKAAETVMVPLVFAGFVATLTAPLVLWLENRKFPPWLSVLIVVLGVLIVMVGLATVLGGSVNAFVAAVPRYQERLNQTLLEYTVLLEGWGIEISQDSLRQLVNPAQVMDIVGRLVGQLTALLSDTLLIMFTLVFMLLEVAGLPKKLRRALGNPEADLTRYATLAEELKRYVVIKTYLSVATGVVLGTILSIQGVDFALLWGLVAFLLNYIPNIGSMIAAVPPTLLALVQFGVGNSIITASAFVVVNAVVGNVVEPRWMGRKLGLSTLVIWLSLIFWGWLWGPMGMLLSVPLTMIVKILLESSEQFSKVAVLMDQQPMSQGHISIERAPDQGPSTLTGDPTATPRV